MDNLIEVEKAKFRALGIASFKIGDLSEDESIQQYLDEKFTFFFALVRSPGHRANSKLVTWRLFSLSKKNPQIPMGYSYLPGFTFECYDGTEEKTSQEILKRLMAKSYKFSKRDFDSFAMKEEIGKENKLFYKVSEESKTYLKNHLVKMLKLK